MHYLFISGGDFNFKCPALKFAQRSAEVKPSNPVYVYAFEHRTSDNPWPEWTGVMHGTELDYMFGKPFEESSSTTFTSEEKHLSKQLMTYWSNFAKTG